VTTAPNRFEIRVSVLSRAGGRERNEDACGYCAVEGLGCYVLADGAGGHGGGDVAARLAIETVLDGFTRRPEVSVARVASLLREANQSVMARQRADAAVYDMRSTLVLLLLDGPRRRAAWGHVGDSRLYLLRQGRVASVTRDQSLLQDMLDAGVLAAPQAAGAPHRAVLTGSLGSDDSFDPSVLEAALPLQPGDAFLLCSDGFWDWVDHAALEDALPRVGQPDQWLCELERSFAPRLRPGSDNYSAIAVWFGDQDLATRAYAAAAPATPTEGDPR